MKFGEETRIQKAKMLRYLKPISAKYNIEAIISELYDIQSECQDVRWFVDNDNRDALSDALGSEDDAYQFRMQFSDLESDVDRMLSDLDEWKDYLTDECIFDLFTAAICGADVDGGMLGWDEAESDYLPIMQMNEDAIVKAREKVKRLTKDKMLECFESIMSVIISFTSVSFRFMCLKASMDILRDANDGLLQRVTDIEKLYEQAEKDTSGFRYHFGESIRKLEEAARQMPDIAWLQ